MALDTKQASLNDIFRDLDADDDEEEAVQEQLKVVRVVVFVGTASLLFSSLMTETLQIARFNQSPCMQAAMKAIVDQSTNKAKKKAGEILTRAQTDLAQKVMRTMCVCSHVQVSVIYSITQ
jgi:hypothetical protein